MTKPQRREDAPDVVLVLADDLGYSDIGCFGGEIGTPNLDRLAADGVRQSQFYNTARCSPSRASLLTGLHPHETGVGILTADDRPFGYPGTLDPSCPTLAEVLGPAGYGTYMSGKWHLTGSLEGVDDSWPTRRGFQRFFGTIAGAGSYYWPRTLVRQETPVDESELPEGWYYTDAIGEAAAGFVREHEAARADDPMFLYAAFTAPHWPLHAPGEDIGAQGDRYAEGWDQIRSRRIAKQVQLGLIDQHFQPSDRDPRVPAWEAAAEKEWQARRMAVYAAQVAALDRNVGKIVDALEGAGRLHNTLLIFLSDNGGCAEGQPYGLVRDLDSIPAFLRPTTRDGRPVRRGNRPDIVPGDDTTYSSYGIGWANVSNAPFREYKHWVHEGGIATPLIAHWPARGMPTGVVRHQPFQLPDVMATILEATGVPHPHQAAPASHRPRGLSMLSSWRGGAEPEHDLFWEHEGNAAVRRGRWKLVRKFPGPWELYDMDTDRAELSDRASALPRIVQQLAQAYGRWADECGVIPREEIVREYERRGSSPDLESQGTSSTRTDTLWDEETVPTG